MTVRTVYEHQPLRLGEGLTKEQLAALQAFHGEADHFPYYRLIHRGVRFKSYVGVLRVGDLTIEVLPKADAHDGRENYWRNRLFDMLRVVHDLPLHSPSTSHLRTRPHDVLHLYLRLLLEHAETLVRRGLHRAYHGERRNTTALSGRLLFAEHLRYNLVHKERFFVVRDRFDFATPHNQILRQALQVAVRLNHDPALRPRLQQLLEQWPTLPELPIIAETFARLRYPRGTEAYRPAVAIARLLLLRHAPTRRGGRDLPALLFDMNRLWEAFLERTLRRTLPDYEVSGQQSDAYFHSPAFTSTIRPDITLRRNGKISAILDAKWKVLTHDRPSSGDLQQLYTYAHFHGAERVALLYPSTNSEARPQVQGRFGKEQGRADDPACGVLFLPFPAREVSLHSWMAELGGTVRAWLASYYRC